MLNTGREASIIGATMTIATWEYWSVANMLISTHGDSAEEKAELRIAEALENDDVANVLVWKSVLTKIEEIRATTKL